MTFLVSQSEISGKDINEIHPLNILLISMIFPVFQYEISVTHSNDSHPLNILFILIIDLVSIIFTSKVFFSL